MEETSKTEKPSIQKETSDDQKQKYWRMPADFRTYFLLRCILTIVILVIVFWMGTVFGRFHSSFEHRGFYGRHGYMMQNFGMPIYRYPNTMMQSNTSSLTPQTATSSPAKK